MFQREVYREINIHIPENYFDSMSNILLDSKNREVRDEMRYFIKLGDKYIYKDVLNANLDVVYIAMKAMNYDREAIEICKATKMKIEGVDGELWFNWESLP